MKHQKEYDLYKNVWKFIDESDKKHAKKNVQWQDREVITLIKLLNQFHFDIRPIEICEVYWNRITNILDHLESDKTYDFMLIDELKDKIHNMFQNYFADSEASQDEKDEIDLPSFKEIFYDVTDIKYFNKFNFRDLYYGHSKEGKDREYEEQSYFFIHFLQLYDKINKTRMAKNFTFLLHDREQETRSARLIAQDLEKINIAFERKLITSACFFKVQELGLKLIQYAVSEGRWTWEANKLHDQFWRHYTIIHDIVDGDFNGLVKCEGTNNCRDPIKLTKQELKDFESGKILSKKICKNHQEYDESGRKHANKFLDQYFNRLPKVPVTLRWVRISEYTEKEDHFGDSNYFNDLKKFIKENNGIKIIKTVDEYCFNDGKKDSNPVTYLRVTDNKTLFKLVKTFDDAMNYGLEIEVESK